VSEPIDPRKGVGRLSDRSPLALLPVRVETRFANAGTPAEPRHQLWVRIYPDDCSIDTFEATLSDAEVANAKRYWQEIWRAGGVEDDERGAWRGLVAAHGSGRAGYILDIYRPLNLADRPVKTNPAEGIPVFPPDPPSKPWSWSQAPQVKQLPERFVVLGYAGGVQSLEAIGAPVRTPLHVGPDPSADPKDSIHPEGEELVVPEELRWMVDFDAAVAAGMGLAIDLDAEQARTGFDRLLVLGVQLGASDAEGKGALEELLHHHKVGRSGLELVAQGTSTHNTTGAGSGFGRGDNADAEASFDDRRAAPLFTPDANPLRKRDGQWVAEALGIDPALFADVHGAGGEDQLRARAMQRALWPATAGYWMDKMLTPVFGDETVAQARWFFTNHVRGRGAVPALRIGGQPYGIMPTTAFSRIAWLAQPREPRSQTGLAGGRAFMAGLLRLLREIDGDWTAMAAGAGYVGKPGDAHQTLLDVLGLQSGSVEYHWRYSESLTELYNVINLWGLGPDFWKALSTLALQSAGEGLLQRLGWEGAMPEILNHAFMTDAGRVENLIDDRPLSETDPIRAYTDDQRNYITWLIDAAGTSLDALTAEQGFSGDHSPQMLLYLYLRHALLLGYYDTSYELHRSAGFLSAAELAAMKPEPPFIHVDETASASESRYAALYKTEQRITQSPTLLVGEYIAQRLTSLGEAAGLADQLDALHALADAPTAQLERAFAEHIDTCSYRFDAWLLGLVSAQLEQMRAGEQMRAAPAAANEQRPPSAANGQRPAAQTGVYLGAYAWVEDLRPARTQLDPVRLPPELGGTFAGSKPLLHDEGNGGYLLAPSLAHARTAAVLRSGYLANASAANPDTLSVNLSSDRVRVALALLEGIRNGQSLGALLGYNFERGLHDDHGLAEVDKFIYPLRKAFPLVADALASTQTDPGVPIEAIEARNVLDGRKLAAQIRASGNAHYPFGVAGLPPALVAEAAAIDAEANALLDAYDAVADLALAEGVHQAVQGNFDRVAATLDAYASGTFPPDPGVVQTPVSGIGLTHRVALQLTPGLTAPAGATPRAVAEPGLDAWLAGVLPDLGEIGCTVVWSDPVGAGARSQDVTLADLGLRPLDMLELLKPDDVQALAELDDRILRFVLATASPRPDAALEIRYRSAPSHKLSVFEVSALMRSLRTLVQGARPLRATDAMLARDAAPEHDDAVFADRARVAGPKAQLDALWTDTDVFVTTLQPLVADPTANRAALIAGVDGFLDEAVDLLERAARFGLPGSGWGFAYEWRRSALSELLAALTALLAGWDARLADFDARVAAYDGLPPATEDHTRFVALQAAEALVVRVLDPLPPAPATLRGALDGKRAALAGARAAYAAAGSAAYTSFHEALAAVQALPPIGAFDAAPLDLTPFEDRAVDCGVQLATTLAGHRNTIGERRQATQAQLEAHDAAAGATAQVQALQAAAQALLGDSFTLIPEFAPMSAQRAAWAEAVAASSGGALLGHLTETLKIERPVEEWLCGAARVRPPLRAWEASVTLAGAFGRPEPGLLPIQLPYEATASWLAMQFPDTYKLDGERLLYTAHYATPFDANAHQCGLLLDEWTEVIPSTSKEAGITFNFDRPDNEPPQAILVVTPATANGAWQWEDIVGALNETLDLAKKRALEPAQLDPTAYARLLPATIMAVTLYGISITTSLAVANGVLQHEQVAARA
jgi:hypothetical protein